MRYNDVLSWADRDFIEYHFLVADDDGSALILDIFNFKVTEVIADWDSPIVPLVLNLGNAQCVLQFDRFFFQSVIKSTEFKEECEDEGVSYNNILKLFKE